MLLLIYHFCLFAPLLWIFSVNHFQATGSDVKSKTYSYFCFRVLRTWSHKITDVGVSYLCVDDGTYGKCKKLEEITLGGFASKIVTVDGIVMMLENLPKLRMVYYSSFVFQAVLQFAEKHPDQVLQLMGNIWTVKLDGYLYTCQKELEILMKTAPNLEKLVILDWVPIDLQFLNHIACKQFAISSADGDMEVDDVDDLFDVNKFLIHIGHKITYLYIDVEPFIVDVGILAQYCPNLARLNYKAKSKVATYTNFENTFIKLEELCITDSKDCPFPSEALFAILCSKRLKTAQFNNVVHMTDVMIDRISNASLCDCQIMSEIEHFGVWGSQLSNLSLKKILACTPKNLKMFFTDPNNQEIIDYLAQIKTWEKYSLIYTGNHDL